ncbi:hypothetical protein SDC9_147515 [bioreactor metagenome]|uniref:Uncharacterized protein n=1 Tax=bioreactor metagenome TaxID=1076179 RepID=A0A645EEJ9_9ZZZZ
MKQDVLTNVLKEWWYFFKFPLIGVGVLMVAGISFNLLAPTDKPWFNGWNIVVNTLGFIACGFVVLATVLLVWQTLKNRKKTIV